jgi:hypothetical protein
MCRQKISVGWDGTLYERGFNLALGFPLKHGARDHISILGPQDLRVRRIVTGDHSCLLTYLFWSQVLQAT